jgi:hypothetical protein
MRIFILITLLFAISISAGSQQLSNQTRAEQIAASFNKFKHLAKEKYGVRKEKYKDVRCEPDVRQNIRDYSAVYEVPDIGYVINIQAESGRIQATGYETIADDNRQSRIFRLESARISGALLTARKVYADGAAENFEGVFLTRTDRNSPTDAGVTMFGLGVLLSTPRERNGITYDKLFYQRKTD